MTSNQVDKLEGIEVDWKEAFFVLALFVISKKYDEAEDYIHSVTHRPRWTSTPE